jgi:hypothetical protein
MATFGIHNQHVGKNNEKIILNQTCNTKVHTCKCNVSPVKELELKQKLHGI